MPVRPVRVFRVNVTTDMASSGWGVTRSGSVNAFGDQAGCIAQDTVRDHWAKVRHFVGECYRPTGSWKPRRLPAMEAVELGRVELPGGNISPGGAVNLGGAGAY